MHGVATASISLGLAGVVILSVAVIYSKFRRPRIRRRVWPDRITLAKLLLIFGAMVIWGYLANTLIKLYLPKCEPTSPYQQLAVFLGLQFPLIALAAYGSHLVIRNTERHRIAEYLQKAASRNRFQRAKKRPAKSGTKVSPPYAKSVPYRDG